MPTQMVTSGTSPVRLQDREPRVFQRGIVVVVQVVDPDHLVPTVEQGAAQVEPDEAGSTGDEDPHHRLS